MKNRFSSEVNLNPNNINNKKNLYKKIGQRQYNKQPV